MLRLGQLLPGLCIACKSACSQIGESLLLGKKRTPIALQLWLRLWLFRRHVRLWEAYLLGKRLVQNPGFVPGQRG